MVATNRGTADLGTAFKEISRWREPSDMATTFAFLVAQPINTGRRRSLDWGPSGWQIFEQSRLVQMTRPHLKLESPSPAQAMPELWLMLFLLPNQDGLTYASVKKVNEGQPRVFLDPSFKFRSKETTKWNHCNIQRRDEGF